LECQKLGADPILALDTDRIFYGQFKNFTEENLRRTSAHCLGIAEYAQSYVYLGGPKDPGPMARVGNEKFGAMYAGEQAHFEKSLVKKPKTVGVALGQVTRERARTYGFSYPAWKAMVEAAIAVNYGKLGAAGKGVAARLSAPADVHVTADNGTDLRFRIAGGDRRPEVDDGVISDEDLAAGNRDVGLPAGSAFVAPVEESAQGTFVSDVGIPQQGRLIEGLSWTFRDGHAIDISAKRNLAASQASWETATGAKDMFGGFSVGLNPKAKAGFLQNPVVAGTVTIGIGDNRLIGGKNESSYGFASHLAHGTVEIGGTVVIDRGKWVA
ncbi:MAG TPA: aminopeptidase, partial [Thermoplasmata archaeon]|nr:aminopeptidase [Thermoplasmata archaeon]